jgi:hypothetical protein
VIRAVASRRDLRRILLFSASLLAVPPSAPVIAGASLRLTDGRVLEGRDVRREGDLYLLVLEGDSVVPIPSSLVAEVGVTREQNEEEEQGEEEEEEGGWEEEESRHEQARRTAPTGLTYSEPRTLAGVSVDPPSTHEQVAALGEPARFRPDVVTSNLRPSYWVLDPEEHNFNPSTWAKAPIDSTWRPTSAFDTRKDVLSDSRSTWRKAPIDSTWVPEDGFKD